VLENESYDVSVSLLGLHGEVVRRILLPIKTRETEGGGHAHLFTRDIKAALTKVRRASPDDLVCVVIIAKNWSERESRDLAELVDWMLVLASSPTHFSSLDEHTQSQLDAFVQAVLQGQISPKLRGVD